MTNAEIKAVAERVLLARLSKADLDHIDVKVERDESDAPALLVEAFMRTGVSSIGGKTLAEAHDDLSQSLLAAGEDRFPYLRVRYPTEESFADDSVGSN